MQLCSLHHCVLFFILTFTLAPVSAQVIFPTRGKLHQPVTLSCTSTCSSLLIWNLYEKRSVHLAQCNKTSCWAAEGFSISHDKYLRGDFSLTITKADYSKRNVYACECGDSDYAIVRLIIETVFTPVQMKYDEDLKLKVSVPEPVEVIYKRGDAADEVICNVTNGSLQCKDKYRDRTSLTYPELTLRHVTPRDKATYTIRNIEYNDDIQIYAVSVEAVFIPVQTKSDEDLKLKVSVPEPVEVIYKSDDAADEVICNVTKDSLQCKDEYRHRTSLTYPELTLKHMTPWDKGSYTIRDIEYNDDIQIYAVAVEDKTDVLVWVIPPMLILLCCCVGAGIFLLYRKQLERRQQLVDQLVKEAEGGTEEKISEAETSVDQLQQQYNKTVYKDKVKVFCSEKREQLLMWRQQQVDLLVQEALGGTEEIRDAEKTLDQLQHQYINTVYEDQVTVFCNDKRRQLVNFLMRPVLQLVQENKEWKKEDTDKVNMELIKLKKSLINSKYADEVTVFCLKQRSQMNWNRLQYSKEEPFMTKKKELNRKLLHVDKLVLQVRPQTDEPTEAEKAIDELEQQYSYTKYSEHVSMLCDVKRKQLNTMYTSKDLMTPDTELINLVRDVEHLVEQAKGKAEKIGEAEKAISELELKYFTTEYSGRVSFFCMKKRAYLYWYRLHNDKEQIMTV